MTAPSYSIQIEPKEEQKTNSTEETLVPKLLSTYWPTNKFLFLRRRWNSLTRLQKNAVGCGLFVIVTYFLLSNLSDIIFKKRVRPSMVFNGPSNPRQEATVEAFQHAWKGYREFAWGHDHLKPHSRSYDDWIHLGLTIVDSLDTIFIMGLTNEFDEARLWVKDHLSFNRNVSVNVFETTIRVLGGLLSAYHLSGDFTFLKKAIELGHRLLPSFNSPSGIPYAEVNLKTGKARSSLNFKYDVAILSEISSIQLEFRDLSRLTKNPIFEDLSFNVSKILHRLPKLSGLLSVFIDPITTEYTHKSVVTVGGLGDSYYEYLLKQWIQTGRKIDFLRDDYIASIAGIQEHLIAFSKPSNLIFLGQLINETHFLYQMEHLACFLPGTLALGVHHGMPKEHLEFAEDLLFTCYLTYLAQPTHLAPEATTFNPYDWIKNDFRVLPRQSENLLRPETVESLWYVYMVTGNRTYQDWGWEIFKAFERHARVDSGGYSSLADVRGVNGGEAGSRTDKMESFFLAETLKYFYLLFEDRNEGINKILNLDRFLLNTEAHFLPIRFS